MAATQVHARVAVTNWVLTVNITLTAYTQGPTTTNGEGVVVTQAVKTKLNAKDLIAGLNHSYTNLVGGVQTVTTYSFSPVAKLIVKGNIGEDTSPGFFVRDIVNTNVVDTDVSAFMGTDSSDSIKSSRRNLQTGATLASKIQTLLVELRQPIWDIL